MKDSLKEGETKNKENKKIPGVNHVHHCCNKSKQKKNLRHYKKKIHTVNNHTDV